MILNSKGLRRAGLVVAALLFGVAGLTLVALESGGVVTVYTADDDTGMVRTTRIWFVKDSASLYLEAGHPDNPWVSDLSEAEQIRLEGQGLDGSYTFLIGSGSDDHDRIRRLMRQKYGWRDGWIGLLFDTSSSQLVAINGVVSGSG